MSTPRLSPYYWQYDGAQIEQEFRPPVASGATAPSLGKGSQRASPTTGAPEYWDGAAWIPIGTGVSGNIIAGTHTVTGDGTVSSFTWTHGLGFDPTSTGFTIDPVTPAAQGIYSKAANSTNFIVNYDVCPVGTLTFNWTVKQP